MYLNENWAFSVLIVGEEAQWGWGLKGVKTQNDITVKLNYCFPIFFFYNSHWGAHISISCVKFRICKDDSEGWGKPFF